MLAAMEEAEEKRKEKHRKMEEERETMRQGIRDKVRGWEMSLDGCCRIIIKLLDNNK